MKKCIAYAALVLVLVACNKETKVECFNEEKPFSVEITKERSYYQADRIVKRLAKMGMEAYVLEETTEDGQWYRVTSGAFADSTQVEQFVAQIDSLFNLHPTAVLNYTDLDSTARTPITKEVVKEQHHIDANPPHVPQEIVKVAQMYPDNVMFNIKKIGMLPLSQNGIKCADMSTLDMPRGVKLSYLKDKECVALSSVIYEDNLYGDRVTLQVVKCKPTLRVQAASIVPIPTEQNEYALALCSDICDMILNTGKYAKEQKDGFEANAYTKLTGYNVSFEDKGQLRTYYVFTDEAGEYIYMAQTTKENEQEILDFIAEIGKGEGLVEYDEFYNTFYTMADEPVDDDEFLGYYVDRLTWSYAKQRNYANWAKRMVGHMFVKCFFYNVVKGIWSIDLFDLLTQTAENQIYNNLYRNSIDEDAKRTIYGEVGAAIYRYNWWTERYELTEVNLGFDRYVVAASGTSYFSERDLINRIEALQFHRGGYSPKEE